MKDAAQPHSCLQEHLRQLQNVEIDTGEPTYLTQHLYKLAFAYTDQDSLGLANNSYYAS